MANPFNDPATMLEIISNRMFITTIGKVLVEKDIIKSADLSAELSKTIQALGSNGDPMLVAELKNILGAVLTW